MATTDERMSKIGKAVESSGFDRLFEDVMRSQPSPRGTWNRCASPLSLEGSARHSCSPNIYPVNHLLGLNDRMGLG